MKQSHYTKNGKSLHDLYIDKYGIEKTILFYEMNIEKYKFRRGRKDPVKMEDSKIQWYEKAVIELKKLNKLETK